MKLSVVTTIYRTAQHVRPFAARAHEAADALGAELEVIFVDDGSPDDGAAVARSLAAEDPAVRLIELVRNYGQHKALWAGMEASSGDLVAIMDGDMEEDPMWILEFHERMTAAQADVVYGVQERPKGNPVYRASRRVFYRLLNFLSDLNFPPNVATARVMSRDYIDALMSFEEREIWLVGVMHIAGFRQVPHLVRKEKSSPTTYTFSKLFRMFLSALTAYSIAPLIFVFLCGGIISVVAFLLIVAILFQYFVSGIGVAGWTSVMAALFLFSGLITLFNGIIAIYVGTIFLEVKRRPRTIVRRSIE